MMTISIQLKGLDKSISQINKTDLASIGAKVIELSESQIAKKIDARGNKYKPYSKEYAKAKHVSRSSVTLVSNALVRPKGAMNQTGHMLKEFGVIKLTKGMVVLGWTNPKNKAKARGNFNTRRFIGLNEKSRKELFKYVRKNLFS